MRIKTFLRFLNPKSLILRLMIAVSFTTILIFLCFGLYIEHTVKAHFEEMDTYELNLVLNSAKTVLGKASSEQNFSAELIPILSAHPNVFISIEDKNGEIIYMSKNDGGALPFLMRKDKFSKNEEVYVLNEGENYYRMLSAVMPLKTLLVNENAAKITVGMDINFHQHYIHHFRTSLWFAALIACFVAVITSFVVIYFGFRAVKNISRKIQTITTERLNTRLDEIHAPSELKSLILSFNKMIENIEGVFERQSNFSADIAHELRTPISSLLTQIQITLNHARNADEYKEILYSNLEELEKMSKMVNDMLFLSSCEQQAILKDEVDLGGEILKTVEYFSILAEEKNLAISVRGGSFKIIGNKEMISRAAANLISNAIYYAKESSAVLVTLKPDKKELQISNETQNFALADNIERLFDRFYRVQNDRSKSGGSGIGLAIVKSIIKAHNGEIRASYKGGVITFTIAFGK
ncbi:MAG: heavy metal sensor histidine kinase [Campylobacteraceae bacterium]|jgi:two-component system heavy metal sensor histidine kinase CusS|nr:heavy metal sensor histidine kinase [Campylobacteraceae bacterium]